MTVVNSVTLIGNLGRDFELKELGSGRQLAKASLATNESYKNKEGEYVENTMWHNLVVWGKKAGLISSLSKKGSKVAITGKILYSQYDDKEGIKRHKTEIVVGDFKLLDKKEKAEAAPF
jgi:single-strand DNA-binding protein